MLKPSSIQIAYRKYSCVPKLFALAVVMCGVISGRHALSQGTGKQIRIAAAADLQPVMPPLAQEYERATGVKLVVSFGSSATLATQILNGQQVDVFLGADFTFPEKVVAAGLADGKTPTAYAQGTLVLWARKDSPLQPLSTETLSDPRVKSIAIANEQHAPYGRAAVAALHYLKLYDKLTPKLVVAEDISQAAQFVESGNAELGLISLTAASSEHFKQIGTYVLLPKVSYPRLVQYGVVLKASPTKKEAQAFMDWLTSPPIQEKLENVGLTRVN